MSLTLCFQIQFLFNFDVGFYSLLDFIEVGTQNLYFNFVCFCVCISTFPHTIYTLSTYIVVWLDSLANTC